MRWIKENILERNEQKLKSDECMHFERKLESKVIVAVVVLLNACFHIFVVECETSVFLILF